MNPGNSQFADWERGGKTVPGGLDDLGRKTHRVTVFNPDFWDTEPVPMDAQELRRDAIAAASQAPRKRSPILSADSPDGTSNQGREHPNSQSFPLGRLDDLGHAVVLWLCVVVLAVMVPALVFRVTWADALTLLALFGGAR